MPLEATARARQSRERAPVWPSAPIAQLDQSNRLLPGSAQVRVLLGALLLTVLSRCWPALRPQIRFVGARSVGYRIGVKADAVTTLGALVIVVLAGCARPRHPGEPFAVGTSITSPRGCPYEADPAVAQVIGSTAVLVGEGTITERCAEGALVHDVRRATSAKIEGPESRRIGHSSPAPTELRFVAFSGSRALNMVDMPPALDPPGFSSRRDVEGVRLAGSFPGWSLGKDCDGVAELEPAYGDGDQMQRAVTFTLAAPGACTITASMLGVTATTTITVY